MEHSCCACIEYDLKRDKWLVLWYVMVNIGFLCYFTDNAGFIWHLNTCGLILWHFRDTDPCISVQRNKSGFLFQPILKHVMLCPLG